MRPQAAWKVRIQIARAVRPSIRSRRSRISPAALLVNVMARISLGLTPQARMRWATRWVSTLVFPEPAPAMTSSGPSVCSAASRWASFSPARWSFGSTGACTEDIHRCYPPSGSGLPARPAFMDDRGRRENVGEPWVPPRQTLSSAAVIREASVDDFAGAASAAFARARGFEQTNSSDLLMVDPRTIAFPELPAGIELLPFTAFEDDPSPIHHVDAMTMVDEPGEITLDDIPFELWLKTFWAHPLLDRDGSTLAVVDGTP